MISDCVRRSLQPAPQPPPATLPTAALEAQLLGLGLDPRTVGGLLSELPRLLGAGREELNEALRMRGVKPLGQRLKVGISLAEHRRASQANLTAYSGSQIMHAQRAAPPPPPPPSDVSAKELGKILRGEVNALDTPVVLTKHAGDGPSAAEAAHVRARVVEAGSGTGTDASNGGCSTLFSLVDGMAVSGKPVVGVSAGSDEVLGLWTRGLCECGDPKCGCNRLSHPAVRRDFRDRVGQHTASALQQPRAASDGNGLTRGGGGAASLGGGGGVGAVMADPRRAQRRPVRYVSVGSGYCLFDFELLALLQHRHSLTIESVILVDTAYAADKGALAAADRLAAFLAPTEVIVFERLESLVANCRRDPWRFARATTFVHCDAADIKDDEMRDAAAACLEDRGLAFRLTNRGEGGSDADAYWYMGAQRTLAPMPL